MSTSSESATTKIHPADEDVDDPEAEGEDQRRDVEPEMAAAHDEPEDGGEAEEDARPPPLHAHIFGCEVAIG